MDTETEWTRIYVIPYTAPNMMRGQLQVRAGTSDQALERAQAIHARSLRLRSPCTPGTSYRLKLLKREREQIVYGEPREVTNG